VFGAESKTEILMISEVQQPLFIKHYHTPLQRFHLLPPGIAADRRAPANAAEIRAGFRASSSWQTRPAAGADRLRLQDQGPGPQYPGPGRLASGLKQRTRLIVIGQDDPRSFQLLARRLGVADQLQILKGRSDIPRFLLGADLLIHPAYNENTGTVLLEALVAGLPVLTSEVCGYAHYIRSRLPGACWPSLLSKRRWTTCSLTCSPTTSAAPSGSQRAGLRRLRRPLFAAAEGGGCDCGEGGMKASGQSDRAVRCARCLGMLDLMVRVWLPGQLPQAQRARHMKLYLAEPFASLWKGKDPFTEVEKLQGEVYRELEGRRTLRTEVAGCGYFVKIHRGIGWGEIFKNLLSARLPVLGAGQEWRAIRRLTEVGVRDHDRGGLRRTGHQSGATAFLHHYRRTGADHQPGRFQP
jgi:hypothetical protein